MQLRADVRCLDLNLQSIDRQGLITKTQKKVLDAIANHCVENRKLKAVCNKTGLISMV